MENVELLHATCREGNCGRQLRGELTQPSKYQLQWL